MHRIAVVDDEPTCQNRLTEYFAIYSNQSGEQFKIDCFCNGAEFLEHYQPSYQIVFLDIDMPGMDGMNTAKELRMMDEDVCVIFVTNLARYAIHGYEVNALDFIVKPVQYSSFAYKLEKALRFVARFREEKSVMLQFEGVMRKVNLSDILYIESDGSYILYHLVNDICRVRCSMKSAEQKLRGEGFLRCNHSYLVNLKHVTNISYDTITAGGTQLKISRNKKKEFLGGLAVYLGREIG